MGEQTKIEWCDHTFNPWRGCTKVAAGCANCYAETLSKRNSGTLGVWGEHGTRVVASAAMWREPIKWNEQAEKDDVRRKVFCASLADVFEDWRGSVSKPSGEVMHDLGLDGLRAHLFSLIDSTPYLDWLLLTKRPENIPAMMPPYAYHACETGDCPHEFASECDKNRGCRDNLWLGTSIANQADADRNIPLLLECRQHAAILFVSAEPLLGPVDLEPWIGRPAVWSPDGSECEAANGIDWLIVGGESGPNARPCHPDWVRSLRNQAMAAGVPFFFKQWGEWAPTSGSEPILSLMDAEKHGCFDSDGVWRVNEGQFTRYTNLLGQPMYRVGKAAAGRLLDGREWSEAPR